MSESQASVNPKCIEAFNELKLTSGSGSGHHSGRINYIIFKLTDDLKEIVVEETAIDGDWGTFELKLQHAKSSYKGREGNGPRYTVCDFKFEHDNGGFRNKLAFIFWNPDKGALRQPQMIYTASKESLKNALPGFEVELQIRNAFELYWGDILKAVDVGEL